jgi:hypothetical protein
MARPTDPPGGGAMTGDAAGIGVTGAPVKPVKENSRARR